MLDINKIQNAVDEAYEKYQLSSGGVNASYIPFLADIPSDLTALAVVTVDGAIISAGDSEYRFAIESLSKLCTLALALEELGPKEIQEKIGTDPTGLPFTSIMAIELHGGKPLSPFVEAGAMATVSTIKSSSSEERWNKILCMQQEIAGSQEIKLCEALNTSEQTTNFRNKGVSWLLHSYGNMYCDPMEACDIYTRQCSTLININELATIGATFAAKGYNPITKKQVLNQDNIQHILAEMMMEGLYDGSGNWAYHVGLPAKSGVGGGLLAVVPGVMSIAAFSPPLDRHGNSVKGQKMISSVAKSLGYNLFNPN
ncbi:TPA: glutaminase A [Morganella morganii subsp. morganii]|nr:glutaminase A [Morganella morganii subsp. morganii]